MIFAWMTAKTLGLSRWLWVLLAVALAAALWIGLGALEKADDKQNQSIGRTEERLEQTTGTIERVEKANEVRQDVSRDRRLQYDECVRSARTPANCERLLSK